MWIKDSVHRNASSFICPGNVASESCKSCKSKAAAANIALPLKKNANNIVHTHTHKQPHICARIDEFWSVY